ncbi:MAG: hypothetical protein QM500_07560 [Methylococcales bacterium]
MSIFLKTYLLSFSLLLLLGAFNLIVDPYGIHDIITINGFNSPKSEMQKHEKLFKAYMAGKIEPKSVVLGTSRADFGIDPSNKNWQYESGYNMSLAGGDVYVTRRFMEHIAAIQPPKEVVMGLDFFTFNAMRPQAPDYNGDILAIRDDGAPNPYFMRDIFFTSTLSINALIDSYTTVLNSGKSYAQTLNYNTGMRQFIINGNPQDMRKLNQLKVADKQNGAHASFAKMENLYLKYVYFSGPKREYYFKNPSTGSSMLEELEKIIAIFKRHDTKVHFFISPAHARQYEVIRNLGLWPMFEQWKKEVVAILENEYGDDGYNLWDFSAYNSITTINVPEMSKMREYIDSTHYSPYTGDLILSKIFDAEHPSVPEDFGRKINSKTIDFELKRIRDNQQHYIETHGSDVSEIKKVAINSDFLTENIFIQGGDRPYGAKAFKSTSKIVKGHKLEALRKIEQGLSTKEISKKYNLSIKDIHDIDNKYRLSRN